MYCTSGDWFPESIPSRMQGQYRHFSFDTVERKDMNSERNVQAVQASDPQALLYLKFPPTFALRIAPHRREMQSKRRLMVLSVALPC
jgi:hypothetical protein